MKGLMIAVLMIALVSTSVFVMASNPAPKSGTSYIKGNKLIGQIDSSDQMLMYQLDARGDVRTVIEQDGDPASPIAMQDYLPFGGISSYGIDSRHKYKTLEYEDITNLYLGGYDPEIGRFIVPVTSDYFVFDPITMTPFVKDRNNPYRIFNAQEIFPKMSNRNPPGILKASRPVQREVAFLPSVQTGGSRSPAIGSSTVWYLAEIGIGVYNVLNPTVVKEIVTTTVHTIKISGYSVTTEKMIGSAVIKSWRGWSETYVGGWSKFKVDLGTPGYNYRLTKPDGTIITGETGPEALKNVLGIEEDGWINAAIKELDHRIQLLGTKFEIFDTVTETVGGLEIEVEIPKTEAVDTGGMCGLG